jgi:putative heme-binding domain-containing protein
MDTAAQIIRLYSQLDDGEKQAALDTLSSRAQYAAELLEAVANKAIPSTDITTVVARQIQQLGDEKIKQRLGEVWGTLRQTSGDRAKLIREYQSWLTPKYLETADLTNGRQVFKKTCRQCHLLYGDGGKIGPDLTGSNRNNLHYVLENVLDPSAAVARAYRLTTVLTDEGRIISGIAQILPNNVYAIQTAEQQLLIPAANVEELNESKLSMMPEGLFDKLSREEIRDLVAYLASQTP